jgi:serine phosphatase RsbU (regulator of sigma subunit)
MGKTTVFKQLITNIITPLILALLVLAYINYQHNKNLLVKSYEDKSEHIIKEIKNVLNFQDFSLALIEKDIDKFIRNISEILTMEYFQNTDSIEQVNLERVRTDLGMKQDIYIINREGVIINTTFLRDLRFNLFKIDEQHKQFLLDIFDKGDFVSEKFSLEKKTKKLKKYTYQPTLDGKYIVELGTYSNEANRLVDSFMKHIEKISKENNDIISVDLFIGRNQPVSFSRNAKIDIAHIKAYQNTFDDKKTRSIVKNQGGKAYYYEYIYMDRANTDLYEGGVIRIVSDRSEQAAILFKEILTLIAIFGVTIAFLTILIFKRARSITTPIKHLVENAEEIEQGNLSVRAQVEGNNEISTLGKQFNSMIERLATYYNELEQKVAERTSEVVKQKEEIEKQKTSLTDSIHYAKRIQTAILPSEVEMKETLNDHFLFYQPKDIVSGDFYWLSKKSSKVMIAAADCTGHGVPGAFMSMIGNSLLNKIVNEHYITKPSQILEELRKGVVESLNKKGSKDERNDGMDMSLCAIDFKKKVLEFAGAFNPLYIARKDELIVHRGDRQPVGNFGKYEQPFTNHEVPIMKGDMIYIFSDGYQDQFGGADNLKYMTGKFKKLLLKISQESTERQKELLTTELEAWRAGRAQVDDILIIGIRV